jgi:predicted phosphate transport protein (TIGR00153 family)
LAKHVADVLLTWFRKRHKGKTLKLAQKQIAESIETVKELDNAILALSQGRKKETEACIKRLFVKEEEIDELRRSVFEDLAKEPLPESYRADLLHLVKRLDVMADYVKDSARSVKVLMDAEVPREIWDTIVRMVRALVECAGALRSSIEALGTDPDQAKELAMRVDSIEGRVDDEYLNLKSLFIKNTEISGGTSIILNDLAESMEHAADMVADTADYIRILAASEETI